MKSILSMKHAENIMSPGFTGVDEVIVVNQHTLDS